MKTKVSKELAQQLFETYIRPKITVSSNGCWEIPNKDNGYGYKQVHIRRFSLHIYVHRLSYIAFIGDLGDLEALHKCDNRGCCNPDHLFSGTQADNMLDKKSKGRAVGPKLCGETNPAVKLTKDQVIEIRQSNMLQREAALCYNVSRSLISLIRRNEIWKEI